MHEIIINEDQTLEIEKDQLIFYFLFFLNWRKSISWYGLLLHNIYINEI